jgi:type III restriction enzyme
MAVDKDFPRSPYEILDPHIRWRPGAADDTELPSLIAPLVHKLRLAVTEWRAQGYEGSSKTSKSLLRWWFQEDHPMERADGSSWNFRYYFAQREAIETIVYLADVMNAYDAEALLSFDSQGSVTKEDFAESWTRYVVKMATGSGKTKVMSLALAWSYFHKCYEVDSPFSRNFLVIAPNVIVLERLRSDFDGLKIFFSDPVLPPNGWDERDWQRDFQLKLHIQDDVRLVNPVGNIFLTNIHRVYEKKDKAPSIDDSNLMDFFLGAKPSSKPSNGAVELEDIVRDIDELMVINDEAHHVHDSKLAWFTSIRDIHNKLKQKGSRLSLQIDVTATPKHTNGGIFVQTISDYPLVEAITQNVVKKPVVPDGPSRARLEEHQSSKFTERYVDFLRLGVEEWKKASEDHKKLNRKAVLFVMTDDTKNCDEVKEWLEQSYSDLRNAVLVIHTNKSGDISEASSGKAKDELDLLRQQANAIDSWESPYKVVVSVLMLKEGWDVQNVTTIVGLRSFSTDSKILPEQTLGRGLRRMYRGRDDLVEKVSVLGTKAFMDFVESIEREGVELERRSMGTDQRAIAPLVIEVDRNSKKNIDELEIPIPRLSRRFNRNYKRLESLDVSKISDRRIAFKSYTEDELRQIVFKEITTGEVSHTTELPTSGDIDSTQAIGWFAMKIMNDLRLVGGYDVLYQKLKDFIASYLFDQSVDLSDRTTMRNLSEGDATALTLNAFKKGISNLTIEDSGSAKVIDTIKLKETRAFPVNEQEYVVSRKCIFNRIVGDSHLELRFSNFLDECVDVVSFAKLYQRINFKLDYVDTEGKIRDYFPDFIVKMEDGTVVIGETKGLTDVDVPIKMKRLKAWCEDINAEQDELKFDFIFVPEKEFDDLLSSYVDGLLKGKPKSFAHALKLFNQYKEDANALDS